MIDKSHHSKKTKLDIQKIRLDFPIFQNNPDLKYFDNAATTQKPQAVIASLEKFYSFYNSNIHRGVYKIAERATSQYEKSRDNIARFINATDRKSIVFTSGTTESINLVAHSWAKKYLKSNDEVLITEMEHHSNIIPWQIVCKKIGSKLKFIPIKEDGTLNVSEIDKLINNKTKFISIIHQSNVFGTVNPIEMIIDKAHKVGAKILIDGAQFVPHKKVDVSQLKCDFYVFSAHKIIGPTGVGVLYAKTELLDSMDPFITGGEMIKTVDMKKSTWNEIPWKFEAGTSKIAQVIGLDAAINYIEMIGLNKIHTYINEIRNYAILELLKIPNITIYGCEINSGGGIISFNVKNIHPHDLAQLLDEDGIAIRAGHHCAQPIMSYLKINSTNRVSLYFYNTKNEIDFLIKSIKSSIKLFS